jgi:UDPglucose--hexose-1-phosphate uridylyltransferase
VGNENDGTQETLTIGERIRCSDGLHLSITAVGYHEVFIEHPHHNQTLALMDTAQISRLISAFRTRYQQIRHDHPIEAIVIFKNHGVKAGTSLEHPHSQLAGLPIVPFQFRMRVDEAIRYFDDHGSCLFCDTITDELHCGDRIITTTEFFTAFIPYAALSPFHIWIFPLRHTSSFEDITDAEIADFSP